MTHNFFKYVPLRMKPRNAENSAPGGAQNESQIENSRHVVHSPVFQGIRSNSRTTAAVFNSPLVSYKKAEHQESNVRDEGDDGISLENINNWLHRQERRNAELQAQLNAYIAENGRLKSSLEKSQKEIQNLQSLNKSVQDSHLTVRETVEKVEALCTEVNDNVANARNVLEQVKQDRDTWLNNLKEYQMRHYDKRVMMIHADYQKAISEKDAELSAQRSRSESLEADLIDSVVKIEALQKELSGLKEDVEKTKKEKDKLVEEKLYYETEYKKLDKRFTEMLNERTADVAEELSKEKERNACVFNDLRDCQEKLNIAESQLTTICRELQLVREEQEREPKEKLREEISTLTSEVAQMRNVVDAYKTNASSLQEDLLVAQTMNRRLEEANKSLPMLSKERAALQEKFVSLENESKSLSVMLAEATSQRDLYKNMIDERDKILSDATNSIVELEGKVQSLTTEIDDLKTARSLIEKENKELLERVENAEKNSRQFQEAADEIARGTEEMRKNVEELDTSLAAAKKENSNLKKQLLGCQLKLDYANERLKQLENPENQQQKDTHKKDDCSNIQIPFTKGPGFVMDETLCSYAISQPIQQETSGHCYNEFFSKRSSVHELPPKSKARKKEEVSKTPRNDAMGKETRINPLELLEKADAIVAREKLSHSDESATGKVVSLPDYDAWRHHKKKQRVEHDVGNSNWEPPVAPSPVIRSNRKH